jgi:hypothetical protein
MKTNKYVTVFLFLNALSYGITNPSAAAAESKEEPSRQGTGQAAAHMSMKARDNTNAQWSADPERGWIRAGERHELRDQNESKAKATQNREKQKGSIAKY